MLDDNTISDIHDRENKGEKTEDAATKPARHVLPYG